MSDFIVENETYLRLGVFFALFVLMASLEAIWPKRVKRFTRAKRWFSNIGIMFIGSWLARLVLPIVPIGVAAYAYSNDLGLLNLVELPTGLFIFLSVVLLDFTIYVQHFAMHKVPILWRLHRLHHSDLDYDVTTGVRFHPIEILLSLGYKMAIIMIVGIHPVSVILFEIILNGMAMFNHANFKLPLKLDRVLRLVFVTPDVHRVHHSSIQSETDSNYGFNISVWDRLFGTFTDQPKLGHEKMDIGLLEYQDQSKLGLIDLLVQPFKK